MFTDKKGPVLSTEAERAAARRRFEQLLHVGMRRESAARLCLAERDFWRMVYEAQLAWVSADEAAA